MKQNASFFSFILLVVIGAASQWALAANLTVNCDKRETIHKAVKLLADINPQGPNTITVGGSCSENVVIQSMERLTLITKKGASISDASSGSLAVVDIEDSRRVIVQGFTINGGGVLCSAVSVCYLTGNTIQDAVGIGLTVNGGSHAFLESNVIQNGSSNGASVSDGSQMFSSNDVLQGNAGGGTVVGTASFLSIADSSFLNNAVGIVVGAGSVQLNGATVTGSSREGMILRGAAVAVFRGATITGNGGVGVHLEDGSFAGFVAANVTGNFSGLDVDCEPQFPITRFVDRTGGITNCLEAATTSQAKAIE